MLSVAGLTAGNLLDEAKESPFFRRVVATESTMQLVTMSLMPGERLGAEIHPGEQLFVVLQGGITVKNVDTGTTAVAHPGEYVLIKAGTNHAVQAEKGAQTKLFTVYSPPQHAVRTIQTVNPEENDDQ
jgi:quercetin dioxygenase-like cupin family protein